MTGGGRSRGPDCLGVQHQLGQEGIRGGGGHSGTRLFWPPAGGEETDQAGLEGLVGLE